MALRRRGRERVVLYLFDIFPSLSETFLLREISALSRAGLNLRIAALRPGPTKPFHPEAEPWLDTVLYRPSPGKANFWGGVLATVFLMPVGFACALRLAGSLVLGTPARGREVFGALASAAYLAWRLRNTSVKHVHATWANEVATTALLLAEIMAVGFSFAAHAGDIFTGSASFLDVKAREAEFAVVCSQFAYQWLREQFPPRQRGRLHLVRHGIDLAFFSPRPRLRRQPFYILSVGRLVPKKGFVHLLRAAAILLNRDSVGFELHIFGTGPQERELRQIINGLRLSDCVFLDGPATQEQLLSAYQEADLFVLASAQTPDGNNEGVPNVLVEAMAMQVPVVASRTGGIPELIQHEVTGLLVEPADHSALASAMERMLTDEALRAAVTAAGRLKVEQEYDINTNARQLLELFWAASG
ncbi:MAG: glycosyltransferase family 4 protein [Armatimonadetes bacterium]|nr:glycosyltransferase family 4 protein [Armatimonadota bacterium]